MSRLSRESDRTADVEAEQRQEQQDGQQVSRLSRDSDRTAYVEAEQRQKQLGGK